MGIFGEVMPKNILIFSNGTGHAGGASAAPFGPRNPCVAARFVVSWPLSIFSASEAPQEVGQRDAHRISRALATKVTCEFQNRRVTASRAGARCA